MVSVFVYIFGISAAALFMKTPSARNCKLNFLQLQKAGEEMCSTRLLIDDEATQCLPAAIIN